MTRPIDPKQAHAFAIAPDSMIVNGVPTGVCQICHRSIHDPLHNALQPNGPFQTQQFYAGGADVLNWLITVAQKTQGAEVWRALFENTLTNLVREAEQKGFKV